MEVESGDNVNSERELYRLLSCNAVISPEDILPDSRIYDDVVVHDSGKNHTFDESSISVSKLSPYPSWQPMSREVSQDGYARPGNNRCWEDTVKDVIDFSLLHSNVEAEPSSGLCKRIHPLEDRLGGAARRAYICCSQTQYSNRSDPSLVWKWSRGSSCRFKFMTHDFQGELALGGCNLQIGTTTNFGLVRENFAKQFMAFDSSQPFDRSQWLPPVVSFGGEKVCMNPIGKVSAYLEHWESGVKLVTPLLVISENECRKWEADCLLSTASIEGLHLRCANLICLTRIRNKLKPIASI